MMYLFLCIIFQYFSFSTSVLPPYTPAVTGEDGFVLQEVIASYFNQGYTNSEIIGFLAMIHGVVIKL